jgi:hypothetical protein
VDEVIIGVLEQLVVVVRLYKVIASLPSVRIPSRLLREMYQ